MFIGAALCDMIFFSERRWCNKLFTGVNIASCSNVWFPFLLLFAQLQICMIMCQHLTALALSKYSGIYPTVSLPKQINFLQIVHTSHGVVHLFPFLWCYSWNKRNSHSIIINVFMIIYETKMQFKRLQKGFSI